MSIFKLGLGATKLADVWRKSSWDSGEIRICWEINRCIQKKLNSTLTASRMRVIWLLAQSIPPPWMNLFSSSYQQSNCTTGTSCLDSSYRGRYKVGLVFIDGFRCMDSMSYTIPWTAMSVYSLTIRHKKLHPQCTSSTWWFFARITMPPQMLMTFWIYWSIKPLNI